MQRVKSAVHFGPLAMANGKTAILFSGYYTGGEHNWIWDDWTGDNHMDSSYWTDVIGNLIANYKPYVEVKDVLGKRVKGGTLTPVEFILGDTHARNMDEEEGIPST